LFHSLKIDLFKQKHFKKLKGFSLNFLLQSWRVTLQILW